MWVLGFRSWQFTTRKELTIWDFGLVNFMPHKNDSPSFFPFLVARPWSKRKHKDELPLITISMVLLVTETDLTDTEWSALVCFCVPGTTHYRKLDRLKTSWWCNVLYWSERGTQKNFILSRPSFSSPVAPPTGSKMGRTESRSEGRGRTKDQARAEDPHCAELVKSLNKPFVGSIKILYRPR